MVGLRGRRRGSERGGGLGSAPVSETGAQKFGGKVGKVIAMSRYGLGVLLRGFLKLESTEE